MKAAGVEKDLMSLDEPLLSSILSLLPLEEAVRTSSLSKKWKNMWKSMPFLDINQSVILALHQFDEDEEAINKWVSFIDNIIASHYGPIQSCTLDIWSPEISSDVVYSWIHGLIDKQIGEFIIQWDDTDHELFSIILNCPTIKTLELIGGVFRLAPNMFMGCKNLRTLILQDTGIEDVAIQHLLSQCTSLESLTINWCEPLESSLHIISRFLKDLKISHLTAFSGKNIHIDTPRLKSLTLEDSNFLCEVDVHAPELETVCCYSSELMNNRYIRKVEVQRLRDVLSGTAHVTDLQLGGRTAMWLDVGCMEILNFSKLKKLLIQVDLSDNRTVTFFSSLLKSSSFLEELQVISIDTRDYYIEDDASNRRDEILDCNYWEQQEGLDCVEQSLNSVVIKGFKGDDYDKGFEMFLRKKAKVLKHMIIS
ncbi:F-box/LRR-repeat protein At3g26922-like [Tasmannia lanceolata]|uniref:F-box/LRR-repeat protein At3g26922-like n=1 Tax=Tasmannia lanceolata TaxID=3420 RepID=UPI004062D738